MCTILIGSGVLYIYRCDFVFVTQNSFKFLPQDSLALRKLVHCYFWTVPMEIMKMLILLVLGNNSLLCSDMGRV